MRAHNLGTVFTFEYLRAVTKKRFWLATLAVPAAIAVVLILSLVSGSMASKTADGDSIAKQSGQQQSIEYLDNSGLVSGADAARFGARQAASKQAGIDAVSSGHTQMFVVFPKDPAKEPIEVYGQDKGIVANGQYGGAAKAMISQVVKSKIGSGQLSTLAEGNADVSVTTYKDGKKTTGMNAIVAPAVYVIILYLLIIMLANLMLTSTLEEKENRVTEMILTTLRPNVLLRGKILAILAIGLTQMVVFAAPAVVGYVCFRDQLKFPALDLSALEFNPAQMILGALILVCGFALFITLLAAIGAVMPTAKDAGSMLGVVIALLFVPIYTFTLVISEPKSLIVQIFTYFPLTAPITALLRNAVGNLQPWEGAIVVAILAVCAALMFRLAVKLYAAGSISYSQRLKIRAALRG